MLFSIACLIACRLIRNHFAVPVREVAMLTSSSCRTRVCCARSVLCRWRAGRSLVGGVRLSLGPSLNLWALPCLPRAAVWSCACSVVLRDAGPPLARRGCRVMGWWLSAPPLPQWRGRGFPCASHLCGVGPRTEGGGGFYQRLAQDSIPQLPRYERCVSPLHQPAFCPGRRSREASVVLVITIARAMVALMRWLWPMR